MTMLTDAAALLIAGAMLYLAAFLIGAASLI
jgi:hypothetical protein